MIGSMSRLERGVEVSSPVGYGSDRSSQLTAGDAPLPETPDVPAGHDSWLGDKPPTLCRLLSVLADNTRRRILQLLAGGELPVISLTRALRVPQPTVSHHLAGLRMMDLVYPRRQGKHIFYALGPAAACAGDGSMTLSAEGWTVTIRPHDLPT